MSDLAPTHEEAARIERDLLRALGMIRDHWGSMHQAGSSSIAAKAQPKATITLEDDDESSSDIPQREVVTDLRREVTLCLNGWARVVVEENGLTHHLPLGTDTIGLVEFMERWSRWFSGHEAALDAATELAGWAAKVKLTAAPQRREWIALGPCPLEVEVDEGLEVCAGSVRAYPEKEPRCQRCGTEAVASWWERVMFPDAEMADLVTADELVLVLHRAFGGSPVKPSTIRQWIRRGVILPSGKDDKGRTLYSREAVIYAISTRGVAIG